MAKPVIATTISGLYIKSDPWKQAHRLWFEQAAEQLNDPSIKEWIDKPDYFTGVDEVTKRLFPDLTPEQQTAKARELYFNSVLRYIEANTDVVNREVIEYFKSIKITYDLALITTNTAEALKQILTIAGIDLDFEIIETSLPEEKDDKKAVFDRYIQKHGKPALYIGGDGKASYDICLYQEIPCVYANLEGAPNLEDVQTVHSIEELKQVIDSL